MRGRIQPGLERKTAAKRSRGAAVRWNSGRTQAARKLVGAEPAIAASPTARSLPWRANSAAMTNTSALTATPTQTVPFNPRAGSRTKAAASVPNTAPAVLVAYNSATFGPTSRLVRTA